MYAVYADRKKQQHGYITSYKIKSWLYWICIGKFTFSVTVLVRTNSHSQKNCMVFSVNFPISTYWPAEGGGSPDPFVVKDFKKGPFFVTFPNITPHMRSSLNWAVLTFYFTNDLGHAFPCDHRVTQPQRHELFMTETKSGEDEQQGWMHKKNKWFVNESPKKKMKNFEYSVFESTVAE